MSRDIPIIFSAPMVLALLAGRKTMTRRLAWRSSRKGEKIGDGSRLTFEESGGPVRRVTEHLRPSPWRNVRAGDRLWVRESLTREKTPGCGWLAYAADGAAVSYPTGKGRAKAHKWASERDYAPSIHMPRWASRITLEIKETFREPLTRMCDEDALAEGVVFDKAFGETGAYVVPGISLPSGAAIANATPVGAFACLWDCLHGSGEWLKNPEVVVMGGKVRLSNIDAA